MCDQDSVDTTGAVQLLLNSIYTASRPSLFLCPPSKESGEGRRLGGDTKGQLVPSDQRDIPYHVTSGSATNLGGKVWFFSKVAAAQTRAGHRSAGGRW